MADDTGQPHAAPRRPLAGRCAARRPVLLLLTGMLGLLGLLPAGAQPVAEYQVKAAFLVKFGSYVEWPAAVFESRESPFVIGVVAPDAVADEVERAASAATVEGRPVQVRRLERADVPGGTHLLFIARSHNGQLADTLALARGRPLLTVTESEQALALGGMINFVIVDNKVRFDIALAPAEASQLKISARLLSVARRVLRS
ncbi:YfiR family protein [Azohydromonas caseinilytica]|uniref:YfiR family protein n=1 Tax=Azohydromonas caseinilytica TaxID=2728836 RepID=A0A848F582_9BURK|nr:YfiR family protein [Azohydromonas caseinilytica]NML13759.1 YfiR family protein [Azohydromonas caseinilytica]